MIVGNIMVSLFLLAEAGFLLKISNKLKIKQNRPKKKNHLKHQVGVRYCKKSRVKPFKDCYQDSRWVKRQKT